MLEIVQKLERMRLQERVNVCWWWLWAEEEVTTLPSVQPWYGLAGAGVGGNSGKGRESIYPWLRPCRRWRCHPARWRLRQWGGQSGTHCAYKRRAGTRGTPTATATTCHIHRSHMVPYPHDTRPLEIINGSEYNNCYSRRL